MRLLLFFTLAALLLPDAAAQSLVLEPGDVVVADPEAIAVFRIDPVTGAQDAISDGGSFQGPTDLVREPSGRLVVADPDAGVLFRVDPSDGAQTPLVTGMAPTGVAVDDTGDLYFVNNDPLDPVTLLRIPAGSQQPEAVSQDPAFVFPLRVALAADGTLYVTDPGAFAVFAVNPSTGAATPLATGDPLVLPVGIAIEESTGDVLVADSLANAIFRIPAAGGAPVAIATNTPLGFPVGVTEDLEAGDLVVSDGDSEGAATPRVLALPPGGGDLTPLSVGMSLALPAGIRVVPEPAPGGLALAALAAVAWARRRRSRASSPRGCIALLLGAALLTLPAPPSGAAEGDFDDDGVADFADNCIEEANLSQADGDADDVGDACDCDFDNDGECDLGDFGVLFADLASGGASGLATDMNGDGSLDTADFGLFLSRYLVGTPGPSGPLSIATTLTSSPTPGEDGVSVTRQTVLRFTRPLSAATVVDASIVFASFGGSTLPASIDVSGDRKTVRLFYEDDLPASARVRVQVLGDALLDDRGVAVDADGDGAPGGTAVIDFDTLSLTLVDGTAVCGRVFASELMPPAMIGGTPINEPLEGVTIRVEGDPDSFAVTDSMGNFRLEPAPAGRFFVVIDGATASNPVPAGAYYPTVGKPFESAVGRETNIGEIYLPLVAPDTLQEASLTEETVVGFPSSVIAEFPEFAGVQLMVPPDTLFDDAGNRGGEIGIAPVDPDRLPGPLPPGLEFPLVITIQTNGPSNFDQPVPICLPNLPDPVTGETLAPGEQSGLWSFDHDVGAFNVVGSVTVTEDGLLACSDPGIGILAPGWHAVDVGVPVDDGPITDEPPADPPETIMVMEPQECTIDDDDAACLCKCAGAVLLHSGEERFSRVDLVVEGRGEIDFVMERRYRSRIEYDGPLGHGWDFSYNETLLPADSGNDLVRQNGGSHVDRWTALGGGQFQAPDGHFRTLVERPDGTRVLRAPDGFKRYYRSDGRLYAHEDRNGNLMLFDYDAAGQLDRVIDPYGREIDFVFETQPDGASRLARIADFTGREVEYRYDANGDLVEVRGPIEDDTSTGNDFPGGRTERYVYSSGFAETALNHNIVELYRPQEVEDGGPPAMQWVYGTDPGDPLTFDKVVAETEGGTNASGVAAGGTTTFDYESLNEGLPPGSFAEPRGKVTVTERNGNVWEYFVNERAHHIRSRRLTRGLRAGEPAFYETTNEFTPDGLLTRQTMPEGNAVELSYDTAGPRGQQKNLVEKRLIAGPRGGGDDLVTTYGYEPLFNRLASETDPRGNDPGFVPPLGAASAERYTTRFTFDYQEGSDPVAEAVEFGIDLSGVPRGLGDQNADGRTDQVAGNVVRTTDAPVLLEGGGTQDIITERQWNDVGQLTAAIDPEGNVTAYAYLPENDPDGDGELTRTTGLPLSADPQGYLASMTEDAGPSARRTAAAPPTALQTTYGYDPVGNLTGWHNPRGVATAREVNAYDETVVLTRGADVSDAVASGQLVTGEAAFAYEKRIFYDDNGRVVRTEVENRDGNTAGVGAFVDFTVEYDILDNPVRTTAEVDAATVLESTFRYDPNELLVSTVRPEGNETRASYDERDLVFEITRGFGGPEASTTRADYDDNGNLVAHFDAVDNDGDAQPEATSFFYDGFDRRIETVDRIGNRILEAWDPASNRVARQVLGHPAADPAGTPVLLEETTWSHDEQDRVFRQDESLFLGGALAPVRTPDLRDENDDALVTTRTEWDADSRMIASIEDDGERRDWVYDGANRVLSEIDALGNELQREYDANDNVVLERSVERSPEGLVPEEIFISTFVYDQLDRLVRESDNAGQTRRYAYDSRNNEISMSDGVATVEADPLGVHPGPINAPGNSRETVYDGIDRVVASILDLRVGGTGDGAIDTGNPENPDGRIVVGYDYDGNSNLSAMTDDAGNLTEYEHDSLDRLVQVVNADTTTYQLLHDADDNVVEVVDPNGSVVTREYDGLDRLTLETVARAPGVGGSTSIAYDYDGLSRTVRRVDDNGGAEPQTAEFVFDSLSRVIEERQNGFAISSVLEGDGRRSTIVHPSGRTIDAVYDAIDRTAQLSDGAGLLAASSWIGPDRRELLRSYGSGASDTWLDDTGSVDIGYDAVKRVVRHRSRTAGASVFLDRQYGYDRADHRVFEQRDDDFGLVDVYTHDSSYRIVEASYDTNDPGGAPLRDLAGELFQLDGVGNRADQDRELRSTGPELVSHTRNEMNEYTSVGGIARSHDANGNLLQDASFTYSWDYRNRLVEVRDVVTGNRVATYLYHADGRRSRKRVFDPATDLLLSETAFSYDGWDVVEERDGADVPLLSFVWHPAGVDDLVQGQRTAAHPLGAGEFFAHQNARGDVVALSDGAGNAAEATRFTAFGAPDTASARGNPYGFQGRRLDEETGLYWFRHRYYDPILGRFLSRDPLHDPANVGNAYTFAANSPASLTDALGLQEGGYLDGVLGRKIKLNQERKTAKKRDRRKREREAQKRAREGKPPLSPMKRAIQATEDAYKRKQAFLDKHMDDPLATSRAIQESIDASRALGSEEFRLKEQQKRRAKLLEKGYSTREADRAITICEKKISKLKLEAEKKKKAIEEIEKSQLDEDEWEVWEKYKRDLTDAEYEEDSIEEAQERRRADEAFRKRQAEKKKKKKEEAKEQGKKSERPPPGVTN